MKAMLSQINENNRPAHPTLDPSSVSIKAVAPSPSTKAQGTAKTTAEQKESDLQSSHMDKSTHHGSTCPLHHMSSCSRQTLHDATTLDVLNLIPAPLWVFDVQCKHMWWANATACNFWSSPSLPQLLERDFATDMSESTFKHFMAVIRRFQEDPHHVHKTTWTFHPNFGKDGPKTCDLVCTAIRVTHASKLSHEQQQQQQQQPTEEQKTKGHLCMLVYVPRSRDVGTNMEEKSTRSLLSTVDHSTTSSFETTASEAAWNIRRMETLRHLPVVARQFDAKSGMLLDQNPEANDLFGIDREHRDSEHGDYANKIDAMPNLTETLNSNMDSRHRSRHERRTAACKRKAAAAAAAAADKPFSRDPSSAHDPNAAAKIPIAAGAASADASAKPQTIPSSSTNEPSKSNDDHNGKHRKVRRSISGEVALLSRPSMGMLPSQAPLSSSGHGASQSKRPFSDRRKPPERRHSFLQELRRHATSTAMDGAAALLSTDPPRSPSRLSTAPPRATAFAARNIHLQNESNKHAIKRMLQQRPKMHRQKSSPPAFTGDRSAHLPPKLPIRGVSPRPILRPSSSARQDDEHSQNQTLVRSRSRSCDEPCQSSDDHATFQTSDLDALDATTIATASSDNADESDRTPSDQAKFGDSLVSPLSASGSVTKNMSQLHKIDKLRQSAAIAHDETDGTNASNSHTFDHSKETDSGLSDAETGPASQQTKEKKKQRLPNIRRRQERKAHRTASMNSESLASVLLGKSHNERIRKNPNGLKREEIPMEIKTSSFHQIRRRPQRQSQQLASSSDHTVLRKNRRRNRDSQSPPQLLDAAKLSTYLAKHIGDGSDHIENCGQRVYVRKESVDTDITDDDDDDDYDDGVDTDVDVDDDGFAVEDSVPTVRRWQQPAKRLDYHLKKVGQIHPGSTALKLPTTGSIDSNMPLSRALSTPAYNSISSIIGGESSQSSHLSLHQSLSRDGSNHAANTHQRTPSLTSCKDPLQNFLNRRRLTRGDRATAPNGVGDRHGKPHAEGMAIDSSTGGAKSTNAAEAAAANGVHGQSARTREGRSDTAAHRRARHEEWKHTGERSNARDGASASVPAGVPANQSAGYSVSSGSSSKDSSDDSDKEHDLLDSDFVKQFVDGDEGKRILQDSMIWGHDISIETQLNTKNGPKWFSIKLRTINDPITSKPIIIFSARDISSIMQAAKEEADRQNIQKSEFFAVMAHEIRTPLHQVVGFIELLASTSLDGEQTDFVNMLQSSTHALMAIINDLLDFTKLEAGKMKLEIIPFEVRSVLQGSVAAVLPQAEEKGLKVEFNVNAVDCDIFGEQNNPLLSIGSDSGQVAAGRIPVKVRGDPNRLRQIILNMLTNAVKFTSAGHIRVTATRVTRPGKRVDALAGNTSEAGGVGVGGTNSKIDDSGGRHGTHDASKSPMRKKKATALGDEKEGGSFKLPESVMSTDIYIRFAVQDTGIGMTPDQCERIFNAYQQADSSVARKFGGTGLGLAICKSLVEAMHGEIGVSSTAGVGTTFWFELPFQRNLARASSTQTDRCSPIRNNRQDTSLRAGNNAGDRNGGGANSGIEASVSAGPASTGELPRMVTTNADRNKGASVTPGNSEANHNGPLDQQKIDVGLSNGEQMPNIAVHGTDPAAAPASSTKASNGQPGSNERHNDGTGTTTRDKEGGKGEHLNVLVAEDNKINQKVIANMLKRLGHVTTIVDNGELAVEKVCAAYDEYRREQQQQQGDGARVSMGYDIVLMDWQMPVMDGIDATKEIRSRGIDESEMPIVGLTASIQNIDWKIIGMNDCLKKPVRIVDLKDCLTRNAV